MEVSIKMNDVLYKKACESGDVSAFCVEWIEYGLKSHADKVKAGQAGGGKSGGAGGKVGGLSKSPAKRAASKANGSAPVKPGSRPRGRPRKADRSGVTPD